MNRIQRKRKLIAVLLLTMFLVLTASSLVLAADQPSPLLNNSDIQTYNQQNPPSYGEKFIAGIITGAVKWLMHEFYIDDPIILVFGQDPRTDKDTFLVNGLYGSLLSTPNQVVLGIFPLYFFKAIAILYDGFTKLLPIPLVLLLVITGIIFMINSGTTEGRNKIKDYTQAFITAIITLRFGAYIWTAIISTIHFIVRLIWAYMLKSGVKPAFFMDMVWGPGQAGFNSATQIGSLPLAALLLAAAMMVLSLNYQYVMRMITLGALILIFPIVTTLSVFPTYRHGLQTWMKEFIANSCLVLAHALAFGVFFILLIMPGIGQAGAFWLMLGYFVGLPAITGLIREFLGLPGGIRSGYMGAAAGMAGVAALGNIGGMFKPQQPEGHSTATGSGTGSGSSGGGSTQPSPRLSGATSFKGRVTQGAFNGVSAVMGSKNVQGGLKGVGKGALGLTSAMAGAAMSTMTGGGPGVGMAMGIRTASAVSNSAPGRFASSTVGGTVTGLGSGAKSIAKSISADHGIDLKNIGSNLMSDSIQKGGVLAGTNWGLQAAINKVSGVFRKGEPLATPSFVKENRDTLNSAMNGMNELTPQMDLAKAKYEQSLTNLGPDNQKTKDLFDQYQGLQGLYDSHATNAKLAQNRLRSPAELQRHKENFSQSRGKLD